MAYGAGYLTGYSDFGVAERVPALHEAGPALAGTSYTRGPLEIITSVPEVDEHGRLVLWVKATRGGVPLALNLSFIYVNPPIGIRQGDGAVKVDHLAALKDIVADTVDRFSLIMVT